MNEQNNNINPTPQPINNGQVPIQPTPNTNSGVQNPAVQNTTMQSTPSSSSQIDSVQKTVTPSVNPGPTTPVNTPTPNATPIPPVTPVTPTVQQTTNTPTPMNSVQPNPIASENMQPVTPQPTNNQAPSAPVNPVETPTNNTSVQNNPPIENIPKEPTPITPIQNNPSTPSVPVNGVFAPSVPIGGATDATNVGFVATSSEMPKKKNKTVIIVVIIAILAILAAVGYFVVYPYVMKTYFSDPKNVYETTIKSAFKGLNNTADDLVHNKAIYSLEASLDSNIESLKEYVGYTYGLNIGIDPTKKSIQEGIYIKNNSTDIEHSYYSYLKDNKFYDKYSSYRDYIYLGEATNEQINSLAASLDPDTLFTTSNNLNNEDTNYVINKVSDLLIESIDEKKLTKEDASIVVNGETLKVTNNKYEIDKDTIKKMIEHIRDGLANDDKALDIIAKMSNGKKEDIKEALNKLEITTNSEDNTTITTSIYTYGNKNEIIGFAINDSDDKIKLYYYNKNDSVEAKLTISEENELTNKTETNVFKLTSTKDGDSTKVVIRNDDKDINEGNSGNELVTLNIKSWNDLGIDLDYVITNDNEKYTGTLKYTRDVNNERAKYSFEFSIKNGDEYITLTFNFNEDWTSEVANINTNAAATLTEEEITTYKNEFVTALKETPIGKLFTTSSNEYDPSINNYYNQNNSYYNNENIYENSKFTPNNEI